MTRRRGLGLGVGVAFALAVAACAGEQADLAGTAATQASVTTNTSATSGSTPAAPSTVPPDIPELDWTEQLLGGGTVDGTSYAGRDLVIWFYAPT